MFLAFSAFYHQKQVKSPGTLATGYVQNFSIITVLKSISSWNKIGNDVQEFFHKSFRIIFVIFGLTNSEKTKNKYERKPITAFDCQSEKTKVRIRLDFKNLISFHYLRFFTRHGPWMQLG